MNKVLGFALGAALLAASPVQASIITLNGAGFDVVYDDAHLGLFGNSTLSGNGLTIIFTPTQFIAQSAGAQGTVFKNDSVTFDIRPATGKRVAEVRVLEAGGYKLVDRNSLTLIINPEVDISGEVRLTNLQDGVSFLSTQLQKAAPPNVACASSACNTTPWTATAALSTPLNWPSPVNGSLNVRFFLEDLLTAESFAIGDSAFIQKKQASNTIEIDVNVAPVPVPPAVALLASALVGMVTTTRRRRV